MKESSAYTKFEKIKKTTKEKKLKEILYKNFPITFLV
jgi:hypothetical protein